MDSHTWCHLKCHVCFRSKAFERMGTLYVENDGTPLCQEFHYEPIFTWPEKNISLLMWWLMTWCERQWLSVINRLIGVVAKFSAIIKIRMYNGLHERYHFILMAMEMNDALRRDMDCFIKECARLFHDRWSGGHLSLSFCIQFFKQHVSIVFSVL